MKWMLSTGALALYFLAVGCSVDAVDRGVPDTVEGKDSLLKDCCSTDADCTSKKLSRCVEGVCSPAPPEGECWSDADCDAGESCTGASTCPCGAACLVAPSPGTCQPTQTSCDGLDYCSCIAQPDCQPVTEACFCPCGAYSCAGDCACFCGGGAYLGCTSL